MGKGLFNFGKKKDSQEDDDPNSSARRNQEKIANEEKREMIRGIEDLSQTSVKEVMIPRIDVDFIALEIEQGELLKKIADSGHSRFPVYTESIDNVIGVLYVKDLIKTVSLKTPIDLKKIIRKPYFVPETKKIDALLREFKKKHIHIAVVIDEYGGVSGIVCMEDIIEEIVGDIQDEFDHENEDIIPLGVDNSWLCEARCPIDYFNEFVGANLPTEKCDTLGGFLFDLFGKIPEKSEKILWNDFNFVIQGVDGHRINLIRVEKNDLVEAES